MKNALLAILLCLSFKQVFSQATGTYRSRQTGDWPEVTTWEVFNAGWQSLESPAAGIYQNVIPGEASGVISISSGTVVTIPAGQEIFANQIQFGTSLPMGILQVDDDGILNITNGSGHDLRLFNDGTNFSQLIVSGLVRLQTGATIVNDNYAGTVIPASNATTQNTYKVLNGGAHVHNSTDPLPYADWQQGSTFVFYATKTNPVIADVSIQFYNFTWEGAVQSQNLSFNGTLRNVNGNFTINTTNGRTLTLGTTSAYALNVGQNFTVLGNSVVFLNNTGSLTLNVGSVSNPSNFVFASGTVTCATTGTTTLNVSGNTIISGGTLMMRTQASTSGPGITNLNMTGDYTQTGGTVTRVVGGGTAAFNFVGTGTSTFTKNAPGLITNAINFAVNSGKSLDLGTSFLSGTGTFLLRTGSTVLLGSLDTDGALQNNTLSGNIRVSGTRTFQTGSTIVYNGTGLQLMGAGHPATSNTTINNPNAVYMVSNVTINGALTLQDGALVVDDNTLTLGGTASYPNGFIGVTSLSNVVVNGTGNFGTLNLAPVESQSPPNPMNNLTINRTGATGRVSLGFELIVGGTFRQTAGTFVIGENSGFSLTLRGPVVRTGGSIATVDDPRMTIDGAGALPANLVFAAGATLEFFTMDRPGATFITSSPLTIANTLNLFNGAVSHPGSNITMGANSLVLRRPGGSINHLLGAVGMYSVVYEAATPMTTGNELPVATNRLQNLYKQGIATVTLDRDLTVNGELFIDEGTLDAGIGNDLTLMDNLIANGGTFEPRQGLVTFAGTFPQAIIGTSTLQFYNLTVAQPTPTELNLTTAVEIENSLSVTSASTVNAGTELLTLLSNATTTAYVSQLNAGAAIEGTVIAQRYLPNAAGIRTWRYITPVVTNSFVSDWKIELSITGRFTDPVTGPGIDSNSPSMYVWNETFVAGGANRYQRYPNGGLSTAAPLQNGRGYSVFARTEGEISFDTRGRLAQGPRPVAVTNSGGVDPGWNLIGNPYPAPIDWDLVAATLPGAVENAIYITDNADNGGAGGNAYYSDGISIPASFQGIIAPGQAFYVRTSSNATITFQESHKFAGQGQFFREVPATNLLRIAVKAADNTDEIALRMREEATDLFDPKFDALKLPGGTFLLSTISADNKKLAINAINDLACGKTIPLVIESAVMGSYTFSFSGLESFTGTRQLFLKDNISEDLIDLTKSNKYVFTVADTAMLKDRFAIVIGGPVVETTLDITGETICENQGTARVVVANSQPGVIYSAFWNGQSISDEVPGNGSKLELPAFVASLPQGVQQVDIQAYFPSCAPETLTNKAIIKVVKIEKVDKIEHGSTCEPGAVSLKAYGSAGLKFNWYEAISDVTPIATSGGNFVTPVLAKSKTYFVAAVNELGCEGERSPVQAHVNYIEPAIIDQQGSILISNYDEGNRWFHNGVELEGESGNQLEVASVGVYMLEVSSQGCKTTVTKEIHLLAEDSKLGDLAIVVYPNPSPGKVNVEVKAENGEPLVRLINSQGQELNSTRLRKAGDSYSGEFNLTSYPNGFYMIHVRDGQKVYIKKISKIE